MDDRRHNHPEFLGIFHRLFNFISKTLETLVLKLIILRQPLSHGLATCHRLFNFTMQTLAAQAVKPVILGEAEHCLLGEGPISHASAPTATITSPGNVLNKGCKELPIGPDTAAGTPEKGLKKSVSINDTVEEIPNTSKSKNMKTGLDKLPSLESEKGGEPKPLKSILKVGSNLTRKSVSFTIPLNDEKMDVAQC